MHNKSAQRKPAKRKKTSLGKISPESSTFVSAAYNLAAKKRHFEIRKKDYSSLKLLRLPSSTFFLDLEHFLLVPASVYNKSLINQSVTKHELPKYQPSKNPSYQNDSLRKEINEIVFSKAETLVDKILSCPRIQLSNSHTSILEGVETRFFPSNFAQQLRGKNAYVPNNYFTLLDAAGISPTLILNQNAKA